MAKNVVLSWTNPTTRTDGSPLALSDFNIRVSMRPQGITVWTELANKAVSAPQSSHTVPELETGTWEFRLEVIDLGGRVSVPVDGATTIVDVPANPSPVTGLIVTQV